MLSVLLCTHQPRAGPLRETLDALRAQSLPREEWELILVDNASTPPLDSASVSWHANGQVVREEKLGLSRARAAGIRAANGELLVFCDDDNLLRPDYLRRAREIFNENPKLGAAGGKSLPRYSHPPPAWLERFSDRLALRDLGDEEQLASWGNFLDAPRAYPSFAPMGAGLVIRREIALEYTLSLEDVPLIPDRVGMQLSSGGDSDLVLTALHGGWSVGYFPVLELIHLIPAQRLKVGYLARLNRASSESWVRLLARHGLFPWSPIPRWTVGLRQARSFFVQQAWRGPARYLHWADACGLFAGRARIARPTTIK